MRVVASSSSFDDWQTSFVHVSLAHFSPKLCASLLHLSVPPAENDKMEKVCKYRTVLYKVVGLKAKFF